MFSREKYEFCWKAIIGELPSQVRSRGIKRFRRYFLWGLSLQEALPHGVIQSSKVPEDRVSSSLNLMRINFSRATTFTVSHEIRAALNSALGAIIAVILVEEIVKRASRL